MFNNDPMKRLIPWNTECGNTVGAENLNIFPQISLFRI
jgi:hypothetical protein